VFPDIAPHLPGVSVWPQAFNLSKFQAYLTQQAIKHGGPFFKVQSIQTAIVVTQPSSAKWILSELDTFPKASAPFVKAVKDLLDYNIVSANGDDWRKYRNVLSPPFHFDAIKRWVDIFRAESETLCNIFSSNIDKPINLTEWMPRFTIDVLGKTAFSYNFDALHGTSDENLRTLNAILTGLDELKQLLCAAVERTVGFNPVPRFTRDAVMFKNFLIKLIEEKRRNPAKEQKDFVDTLLAADPPFSDDVIISNVFIMIVAGHETTATALSWLIYHLCKHPEVQEKVKNEILTKIGKNVPVTQDATKELHYLSRVLKENLRIQPPAALLPTRQVDRDCEFEGVKIPKGALMWLGIYAIHHNPAYWTHPEQFDPDRFERNEPSHPFAYLPFSLKSRACLGNNFSIMEQTIFAACFFQRFQAELVEFQPAASFVLNAPKKVVVQLSKV
jgi:cytochrome P450